MGLKKNIFYSSFLTTSFFIFQFITYPYVARVLGVTNIGICNFAQSIVNYFMLFSMLGINVLGVREIAKCNGNRSKIDNTFSSLFTFNTIFTLFVLIIYFTCIETISTLVPYKKLLYVGALQIVFNLFVIEWFYKGIEHFKYITMRTVFVRALYVLSVFLFVKTENDYVIYFIISIATIMANGCINWIYSKRFVTFKWPKLSEIRKYYKPLLYLGSQIILASLYTTFNATYLGFIGNDTEVGYYTTATKIQGIIIALFGAFTIAMMPRISSLIANNAMSEVKQLISKSFDILFPFAFSVIIITEFFAPEIIYIIVGKGYEGAIIPMQIVMPLVLIIGLSQILTVQLLIPMGEDRAIFIISIIGASISLVLNILLVSSILSIGSAIVWLISEISVLIGAIYFIRKRLGAIYSFRKISKYILVYVPLVLLCTSLIYMDFLNFYKLIIACIISTIYTHIAVFYVLKDKLYISYYQKIMKRLNCLIVDKR